jgi:hypothetical protein
MQFYLGYCMGHTTVVRVGEAVRTDKKPHPFSYCFLMPTMSSLPTIELDDSDSLGDDPPTDGDRRGSFDYTTITDE